MPCRLRQCFDCQGYGHIGTQCKATTRVEEPNPVLRLRKPLASDLGSFIPNWRRTGSFSVQEYQ
ncbi:hypothetical protein EDB81DRAFT_809001 [Dactylonectria macrodidyma]|uniref:CCHC-type domain-containing protein n=1 Tax=Dactylonectria macrodidyma TaxID=307937 RepID=A0A9P9DXW3_9HYPO|nr:hypothetical protein EDB81DRAFT_809001 [Dactylonectria macrodidyma]